VLCLSLLVNKTSRYLSVGTQSKVRVFSLTAEGVELVQSLEKTSDNVSSVKSVWESG